VSLLVERYDVFSWNDEASEHVGTVISTRKDS